jgi:hypothetical protein
MRRFPTWAVIAWATLSAPCHAVVTHNRLATNRLATNRLATNRLATNRLATNRLATNRLATNRLTSGALTADPSADELLSTPEGRDLYSYVVSCALPAGTDVQATVPGAPDTDPLANTSYTCASEQCVFSGSIGLVPRWAAHKLSRKGQEWISACLLARVNAHDTVEPISMRGPHPALAITPAEAADFPLQEGAFYGNVFVPDPDPQDLNACRGQDQAAGETGGLVDRDCAEPDQFDASVTQCGFTYAGDCADYTPVLPSAYACKRSDASAGFYRACHAVSGLNTWPHARTYRHAITTFVRF